jgi:hypothetical protein
MQRLLVAADPVRKADFCAERALAMTGACANVARGRESRIAAVIGYLFEVAEAHCSIGGDRLSMVGGAAFGAGARGDHGKAKRRIQ